MLDNSTTDKLKDRIGRKEHVSFPDLGLFEQRAKIDSGAYNSSLHVHAIKLDEKEKSLKVQFDNNVEKVFTNFDVVKVKSSNGLMEERFAVDLNVKIGKIKLSGKFSLTSRTGMRHPVLIGRLILNKHNLIIDPSQSYIFTSKKKPLEDPETVDPNIRKMKILILGGSSYTNKRLQQSARKRGHVCHIKSYKNCYLSVESGNTKVFYKGKELVGYEVIIPRIAQRYTKHGTAVLRQFEMQGAYVAASSLAISRSRNKLRSMQLLAKSGIGIPKTIIANSDVETDEILNAFGKGPYIIKTTRGTHGKGVVLAESKKAAKAVMQAFYVENVNFMVQEFIQESAGTDIRVLIVGGRVSASIKRQSLDDEFRSNTHLGAEGVKVKLSAEEKKIAIKAAKLMGLPICGVDLMRSERGPLILEVNSSASIKTPEKVTKKDIATQIIKYIEQNAKRGQKKDRVGA